MIDRPTARIILLDPDDRVLLFQYHSTRVSDPALPVGAVQPATFWTTPGGGLLPGESFLEGAKRELWEETGIKDAVFGPVVLEREKLVHVDGVPILGRERYFVARTRVTEISLDNQEELERADYRDHRWWPVADLVRTNEVVFPEHFASVVQTLIADEGTRGSMMEDDQTVIERPIARVILFDPDNSVLLFRCRSNRAHNPARPSGASRPETFWVTPGGGVAPGESFLECARRELREETGIADADFRGAARKLEIPIEVDGVPRLFREHYFSAHTSHSDKTLDRMADVEQDPDHLGHRWWTLAELESTSEVIFPEGIADLVRSLIADDGVR